MDTTLDEWLKTHKLMELKVALVSECGVQDASDMGDLDVSDAVAVAVKIELHKKYLLWRRCMGAVVGDKEVGLLIDIGHPNITTTSSAHCQPIIKIICQTLINNQISDCKPINKH